MFTARTIAYFFIFAMSLSVSRLLRVYFLHFLNNLHFFSNYFFYSFILIDVENQLVVKLTTRLRFSSPLSAEPQLLDLNLYNLIIG